MVDLKKLESEQLKLAKKVVIKDEIEKLDLIGGVDQAYDKNSIVSCIAIVDAKTLEKVESVYSIVKAKVPYFEGFLGYREGPSVSDAYAKLKNKPDVLIFDGGGILHPRKFGIASQMGVLLDQATIGVSKKLHFGSLKDGKVYIDEELRGQEFISREHARPLYVSPGHKISLKKSLEIVKNSTKFPHKLPEPLHLAHRYADQIREKLAKGEMKIEKQKPEK